MLDNKLLKSNNLHIRTAGEEDVSFPLRRNY